MHLGKEQSIGVAADDEQPAVEELRPAPARAEKAVQREIPLATEAEEVLAPVTS